jgi:hypothetical protein
MSSKEKVLAIRPEAYLAKEQYANVYRIMEWQKEPLTDLHVTEPEAWASAYKYLTK